MDQQTQIGKIDRMAKAWGELENLVSPDPDQRESALEALEIQGDFLEQPLTIYLLATRIIDPDLHIRFHAVRMLGRLLDMSQPEAGLPERSFKAVTAFTTQMDRGQLIRLLEVSAGFLAAEEAVARILTLCSYAGNDLGGIVNDRKLPVEIRQQALFYCGEIGFLTAATAIRNLIQRIEKGRKRPGPTASRRKHLDEESLFSFAAAALSKLEGS